MAGGSITADAMGVVNAAEALQAEAINTFTGSYGDRDTELGEALTQTITAVSAVLGVDAVTAIAVERLLGLAGVDDSVTALLDAAVDATDAETVSDLVTPYIVEP